MTSLGRVGRILAGDASSIGKDNSVNVSARESNSSSITAASAIPKETSDLKITEKQSAPNKSDKSIQLQGKNIKKNKNFSINL